MTLIALKVIPLLQPSPVRYFVFMARRPVTLHLQSFLAISALMLLDDRKGIHFVKEPSLKMSLTHWLAFWKLGLK